MSSHLSKLIIVAGIAKLPGKMLSHLENYTALDVFEDLQLLSYRLVRDLTDCNRIYDIHLYL